MKLDIIDWIAWRQYEFNTGWTLMQYLTSFLSFETFAIVFTSKFNITGFLAALVYVVVPPTGVIAGVLFGKFLIHIRYQERYVVICSDMNPDWKKAMNKLKEVEK